MGDPVHYLLLLGVFKSQSVPDQQETSCTRLLIDSTLHRWTKVDIEWRKWLSEQTTWQTVPSKNQSVESHLNGGFDMLVRVWGPLISLLEIYSG